MSDINLRQLLDIVASSKEREDLAKRTGSWGRDYDYGKSDMIQAANGHYSDSGKLPWHPTFSTESAYSSPEFKGGTWSTPEGSMTGYVYTPSQDMIKAGTTEGLIEYMQKNEPNVELRMPKGREITAKPGLLKSLLSYVKQKELPLVMNKMVMQIFINYN